MTAKTWCVTTAVIVGILVSFAVLLPAPTAAAAAPDGTMTHALPFSLAPGLFDPADHGGSLTNLATFYALHDALVKPMPGGAMAPGLAESWSATRDGLVYEFVLRSHVRFHNGDPLTAEDVKFSFERYRGVSSKLLREKVAAVEIAGSHRVRFRLREAWPDFMTYLGTPVTGAGWVVPKAYVERVGDDGFRKAPVGTGPYRFVSFTPGVELVLEAHEGFWRKRPAVKRLLLKSIPDESTRLAMLKRGDADVAYNLRGAVAEELQRTPGLTIVRALLPTVFWVDFAAAQWQPGSPWHDVRVRRAVNLAIDRQAINQAETLALSRPAFSIVPVGSDFAWTAPPIPHDPVQAKKLLADAGYPNGLDAGDYTCDAVFATIGEAVVNYLGAIGVRARLKALERAAFQKQWQERKLKAPVQGQNGMFGGALMRIEQIMLPSGTFAGGSYPEIAQLFQQQAKESDRARREALLHAIQRVAYERAMFAPIFQQAQLNGVGPRLEVPATGLVDQVPFLLPYEDLRLRP
jgi:peptide/nickel transport system substrate-binding protein